PGDRSWTAPSYSCRPPDSRASGTIRSVMARNLGWSSVMAKTLTPLRGWWDELETAGSRIAARRAAHATDRVPRPGAGGAAAAQGRVRAAHREPAAPAREGAVSPGCTRRADRRGDDRGGGHGG